ncbi:MAG: bifunctional oligoribonuclease/PAP phosphatase NrnA [Bacteroidota bacterium]|nr:bifunctional oligoribonuclease/PAP phosphatase NrnA [Bacteroidota bacterium]
MQPITSFYPFLLQPQNVLITMHQKPDGDAMGSALGMYDFLTQLGHNATVVSPTNWADFLQWMPGCEGAIDFESYRDKVAQIVNEASLIICLDFNVMYRTKNLQYLLLQSTAIKVLIDHHEQPEESQFTYGISNPYKSSTSEMVYDLIVESGHTANINLDVAACLYTGVMTDTGSFRYPSTTASVHQMVAHFKELGLDHTPIHEHIFDNFLENRLRFIGNALLNRLDVLYEYNTAMMAIPRSETKAFDIKTGDTEGLVNYLLSIEGIKFGALLIDREEERRWSFRSKGDFDVSQFARLHFEGGGHKNAAGGRSTDSLENNVQKFKTVLQEYEAQLQ